LETLNVTPPAKTGRAAPRSIWVRRAWFLATNGVVHQADEGTEAHIWQLLMAGQVPIVGFFAIKWLPRAPRKTLPVLALQVGAALASMAPVFFLHL